MTMSVSSVRSASLTSATARSSSSAKVQPVVIETPSEQGSGVGREIVPMIRPGRAAVGDRGGDSCEDERVPEKELPMTEPTPDPSIDDTVPNAAGSTGEPDTGSGGTDAGGARGAASGAAATATSILESLRDAIDDLVDRAGPTVKTYSAKAADVAATAADKAAPLARKAGAATADASSTLAERSRGFAADLRSQLHAEGVDVDGGPADAGGQGLGSPPGPDEGPGEPRRRHDPGGLTPGMSVRPIVLLGDPRL